MYLALMESAWHGSIFRPLLMVFPSLEHSSCGPLISLPAPLQVSGDHFLREVFWAILGNAWGPSHLLLGLIFLHNMWHIYIPHRNCKPHRDGNFLLVCSCTCNSYNNA